MEKDCEKWYVRYEVGDFQISQHSYCEWTHSFNSFKEAKDYIIESCRYDINQIRDSLKEAKKLTKRNAILNDIYITNGD